MLQVLPAKTRQHLLVEAPALAQDQDLVVHQLIQLETDPPLGLALAAVQVLGQADKAVEPVQVLVAAQEVLPLM